MNAGTGKYDQRFAAFVRNLFFVRDMKPQEHYLHPVMDSVAFRDTENELDMAIERKEKEDRATETDAVAQKKAELPD